MNGLKRTGTVGVVFSSLLAVYVGMLNLSDRSRWKLPTDGVEWLQTSQGVKVRQAAERRSGEAGLLPGDRLLAINDVRISTLDEHTDLLYLLAQSGQDPVVTTYSMARGDRRFSYAATIRLESQLASTDFYLTLVALVYLAIGVFIYWRHRKAAAAFHFYLLCLTAFVLFLYRHSGRADGFDIAVYWSSAVAFLLLPPMFLHFCCCFPEPLRRIDRNPAWKLAFYAPFALLAVIHAAWFAGQLERWGLPRDPIVGAAVFDRVHLLHFLVLVLGGAGVLLYRYRKSGSVIQRQQMKWLACGAGLGVTPFLGLYGIPYLVGADIQTLGKLSVLSLGLIPLSMAYAVTKFRLMDVDVMVRRGTAYLLASSALLGLYLTLALAIGHAAAGASFRSDFVWFALAALLTAFLFAPLKNAIQERLDRRFYREAYEYRRSLIEFGRSLGSELDLDRLSQGVCERVCRTLDLTTAALFLKDPHLNDRYHLCSSQPRPQPGTPSWIQTSEEALNECLGEPLVSVALSEEGAVFRRRLGALGLFYATPLRVRGAVRGFLGFGPRADGRLLASDDLALVRGLAGYVAMALDNAALYQSLERKANELAQLTRYNQSVIESIVVGVTVVSPEGEIRVWNNAMAAMSGLRTDWAVGRNIAEALPPDLLETVRHAAGGPGWTVREMAHIHKAHLVFQEGHPRLVNITLAPFLSQDDVVTGALLLFDDITEKSRLEEQLLQADRLSSIGLFAAGVAHEVNTPLAGVASYVQSLLQDTPPEDPRYELLQKIEKQSFRASGIINNLLNFARFDAAEFREVDLNSLMTDTVSLVEGQFRKGRIKISLELDPALPTTLGNGGRLQQVFMNLFLNARDAMPKGGRLQVRTFREDSALVVQVQDNGRGIAPEDVKRIYDPFFTRKGVGKGTGLGLSVSWGIIQEHAGRIKVDSTPGHGTVFTVQLPIHRLN